MTSDEQMVRVAKVMAGVARCLARIEGMRADNTERERNGYALAYDGKAFADVIMEEGVDYNAVIAALHH